MDGLTGRLFEGEVLGEWTLKWRGRPGSYKAAKAFTKKYYMHDPYDPPTRQANDLHALICEFFECEYSDVAFYTAVNSPFDRHGVDGWFEYRGQEVTVDVTLNRQAKSADGDYKADVIALPEHFETRDALRNLAKRIARQFQRKLQLARYGRRPKRREIRVWRPT